jgi:hypothetical protein
MTPHELNEVLSQFMPGGDGKTMKASATLHKYEGRANLYGGK